MPLASHKVMDSLKSIGLNLYERRLWVALLARGTSTAGELSEIANVPRSRSYDILQSLAEKGFVVVQPSKPLKYVAISPVEGLERAKKKLEEDMKLTMQKMDELKSSPIMKELSEIHSQGLNVIAPEEISGALKGRYSVVQQLSSMVKAASKKVNIVTTADGLNELVDSHYNELKRAVERGVKIQIATTGVEKAMEAVKALNGIAEVRALNSKEVPIAGRFAVVDGRELVFSLTDHKVHDTQHMAFWSKSEHAASSLLEPLFRLVWNNSKPVS